MESSLKRRKIEHPGSGLRHDGLIDFSSRTSLQVSTSSNFILQTDELLKSVRLDVNKTLEHCNGHIYRVKEIIDSIEPHEGLPVSCSPKRFPAISALQQVLTGHTFKISKATSMLEKKHQVFVPYPDPRPSSDAPYKVAYSKPSQINVVGSYVSKTMVKTQPSLAVDMVVQMPRSLFQDKDFMDMRYYYRRAYYIAYIAASLRKEGMAESMDLTFECLNENPLLPLVVLRPKQAVDSAKENGAEPDAKSNKKSRKKATYSIRIIPCAPDRLFPWAKLAPVSKCNRAGEGDESTAKSMATPFYNSTLNAEGTFIQYLRLLTNAANECPAFADACILGRIWLQQRGFGGNISQGGFGHFEWAAIVALLLQMGGRKGQAALSTSLSSVELFKAVVQFISTTDFNEKPFAFGKSETDSKAIREGGPVLFDPVRELNIAYKMTPSSASLLRLYAKSTVELLADDAVDKFDPTFIVKSDLTFHVFDAVMEIDSVDVATKFSKLADRSSPAWKFGLEVHRVLKRAYGRRSHLVHLRLPPRTSWPLHRGAPEESTKVTVGVVFEPAQMDRRMEYGPPAEEAKEAASFRHFWGEKAELRRFKDGSILECVEWAANLPSQICEEIARYALKRHLNIIKEELLPSGPGFSSVLGLSSLDKEAFDAARQSFSTLERDVRSLEELPLQIRQLSAVSPLLRYSSVKTPAIGFQKGYVTPVDVNLYFEASNRWPENLTAIQETKVELLLDIDRRLTAAHENLVTYLGRENRTVGIENLAYLDIVYENGVAFRLRIHCDLEETLLERQAENKELEYHIRNEATETLANLRWAYVTLPLHTQTMATFCTRLQPLSQSIRLVKHWFDSHKLSGHFGEELIELFVLHVFLQPYPWRLPSSPTVGFLRTLLFLSRWDWRDEPLVVDSAETLTKEDRSSIKRELDLWRKRDPLMHSSTVIFAATSHDRSGQAYSRNGPSKLVASRMTCLAKAACKLVGEEAFRMDPSAVFQASLQDYDFLIHISSKSVKSVICEAAMEAGVKKHSQFKNLDERTGKASLPARAHPVDVFANELQRVYEDTLVIFRGGPEDNVIAAIWNPKLQPRHKFRAGLPFNFCKIDDGEEQDVVDVNRGAVLLEIARAGGDMIKSIDLVDGE
ncbi:pre-rRNA processing protein Utp22 [Drechmeria coniospora]|uniref:U3 small nucleolar RNA-associated protein 22 n=1 Tax=Drechmeria coniospora TaxID=98403 RepID=A0A151GUE5_DRECN|nr:pre-rRNA processing protein Utp22 [Drechmeria coniospora]KYK60698.1 pre-rRNA processing protein Utp22 [Drechmeria coniospora]